ncbi:MAG: class I SAM-dependent methyltransferase [bacterium]
MRGRIAALAGGLVGLVGLAALGLAAGWNAATTVVAAVLGLVFGAVAGQGLAWLRTTAGRVARVEAQQSRTATLLQDAALKAELSSLRESLAEARKEVREARQETREARAAVGKDIEQAHKVLGEAVTTTSTSSEKKVGSAIESARVNLRTRMEELAHRQSVERRQVRTLAADRTVRQTSLLESYLQLQRLVQMPLPMPRPGAWAASEDVLLWRVGDVLERRPRVVVDLGSGQSSVWMAGAMRAAGYDGVVIGVDHDAGYAAATEDLGRRQGVSPWLRVVHAPLAQIAIDGRECWWYDLAALEGIDDVGLMCVDGPPSVDEPEARWPALPVLRERLEPGARVVLDDMVREGEQAVAAEWESRFPDLGSQRLDFEKGALVITLP